MRWLGIFLTACVVLAAAQAVATALCVLLIVGLVYGLFVAPRETLGLVGLILIAGAFQAYPLAFLAVSAMLVAISMIRRR
ncbi:hypothetical protein [uncultured Novosphingobium sp.]|uniref:hypothetical protein n=1 Tax=uncultured Novosphingobium sp. TaxID=292277 RepID=UPI002590E88D|nr:hypothetical protein [uncultured Novosphingobium sp.]